jgi:hypothetical protein
MTMPNSGAVAADVRRRNVFGDRNPLGNERESKRHRAAALQDAGATDRVRLFPRGLGVRQPYAAFTASVRTRPSVPRPQVGGYSLA